MNERTSTPSFYIEQECILGSFNCLHPILEKAPEKVPETMEISLDSGKDIQRYIELERLTLDLAPYTLDYYKTTYECDTPTPDKDSLR